ncbi:helix-turn-helix transcriptional regulator [Planctomicrobium sp. SH661]|uniref:helix-turn-helix transcriptional regulator n=1 Tax=Planctomicrobium sp. SH661 TaxID=3448124 RepID=UPI003F5C201E
MPRDNPDHEFLTILHRHEPVCVQELCEKTGVTATAVRQRLMRLQSEGLIRRQVTRQERGRPHHEYALTPEGLRVLGNDQGEMAVLLWREVMRIEQPEVKSQVLSGLKRALVERFGVQASGNLSQRMEGMCLNLAGFGFDVDSIQDSDFHEEEGKSTRRLPVLREHNCPYHEIAQEDPSFCEFERSVFSEILQAPVELSACRLDGNRCCEFQVGGAVQ